ncbi:MAG: hypothetical protein JWR30_520 [Conexibacter sp.]|jgi:hypothetical protein|nr:hypothetical protein [Conexibacter sp.]MCZ4492663.1 hypothetical protein [Conexibacter sp.]
MRDLRRRCRSTAAASAVVLGLLALPATALAGSDVFVNGGQSDIATFGPNHSLTSVWTTWSSGDIACANAWNTSGGGYAGDSVCASPGDSNKGHPYCGCVLRQGVGFAPAGGYTYAYIRQFW